MKHKLNVHIEWEEGGCGKMIQGMAVLVADFAARLSCFFYITSYNIVWHRVLLMPSLSSCISRFQCRKFCKLFIIAISHCALCREHKTWNFYWSSCKFHYEFHNTKLHLRNHHFSVLVHKHRQNLRVEMLEHFSPTATQNASSTCSHCHNRRQKCVCVC